jgi:hypothetical protein
MACPGGMAADSLEDIVFTFIFGALVGAFAGALMPGVFRDGLRRIIKNGILAMVKLRHMTASVREDFEDIKAEAYAELEANTSNSPRLEAKKGSLSDDVSVKSSSRDVV